ncbi:unnamed protein product [Leptidea sinapis]|uniref:Methyltransferase type 11 domain-containing protein n=1 Tax=Leptidea sinapis TaxID=189913 RepID=A0A5E4QZT0_9NEOP|nr:unnamed protein product [Leptidea sinapis]
MCCNYYLGMCIINHSQTVVQQNPKVLMTFLSKTNYSTSNNRATVDDKELERFNKLDWWNPNGACRGLHSFNELRVPFVRDVVAGDSMDKHSLDVFTDKKVLEGLAKAGVNITAIDPSPELIDIAQNHSDSNPDIANNKPKIIHCNILITTMSWFHQRS